jgi:hypothetical protein
MSTPAERALAHVRGRSTATATPGAPITVNFHPYRVLTDGRTVAEHLAAEGVYRTQFETGISNGGVGEFRASWEQRMFGGAYPAPAGRPVYGALNLAGYPDGGSPRFGSCHLVLDPAVAGRATFSHGDSVTEPPVHTFDRVWDSLLTSVAETGQALGLTASSPAEWVTALSTPRPAPGRAMDDYVEAHIHGGLTLRDDVTAVVADPSFRGTATEAQLRSLGPPLRWAPGFRLPATDFPAGLRGPAVPPLALALGEPVIDAAVVGRATRSAVHHPGAWARFGDPAGVLQLLKYVWHILVLRGEPAC